MQLKEQLRKAMGKMTQDQLAARAGISQGHLNDILNGRCRSPRCTTLAKLDRALGKKPGYLMRFLG